MAVVEQTVLDALKGVIDPNTGRDFVSSKSIKNLTVTDGDVRRALPGFEPRQVH